MFACAHDPSGATLGECVNGIFFSFVRVLRAFERQRGHTGNEKKIYLDFRCRASCGKFGRTAFGFWDGRTEHGGNTAANRPSPLSPGRLTTTTTTISITRRRPVGVSSSTREHTTTVTRVLQTTDGRTTRIPRRVIITNIVGPSPNVALSRRRTVSSLLPCARTGGGHHGVAGRGLGQPSWYTREKNFGGKLRI